jgi:hypothetical protein
VSKWLQILILAHITPGYDPDMQRIYRHLGESVGDAAGMFRKGASFGVLSSSRHTLSIFFRCPAVKYVEVRMLADTATPVSKSIQL